MSIEVAVRVRPLLDHELTQNQTCIWKCSKSDKTVVAEAGVNSNSRSREQETHFKFHECYDNADSNIDIFNTLCKQTIQNSLKGQNTTAFVYGQTGSGKTHTISGGQQKSGSGLLGMSVKEILLHSKESPASNQLSFEWSCFEIYNEHVRDIMIGQTESSDYLKVIENGTGNFECMGLTNYAFSTYEDFEV
jgi:hypothetical protein